MGKEKRARQKAGTQARREAAQQAAARAKRRRTIIRVGVVVLAVLGVFLGLTLSGQEDEPATTAPTPPVGAEVTAETADGADDSDGDDMTAEPGDDAATETETTGNDMTAEPGDDAATETETTGNDMTAEDGSGEVAGTPEIAPAGGPDYVSYTVEDYGSGPCAPAERVAEPVLHFDSAPMLCIDTSVPHTATFDTSRGVVRVALDVANTPGTVNSFVNLARFGYYDDTLVHRSAPSIGILQGGSPHTNTAADPGPGYTLWDEGTGFTYRPGQLVMARRNEPNSAGAQYFFTVTDDAGLLDGQGTYVVFGEVIEGLDVLSDILASHVDEPDNPLGGAPDPPVVVDSVTIEAG